MKKEFPLKKITVFGANGRMGTNVAALFASFGNCKVFMVSRQKESAIQACSKYVSLIRAD
jgi:3-hydroxyacyl-CoA dehydrogenase